MPKTKYRIALCAGLAMLALAEESWKTKPPAAWSEADARALLAASPWVKKTIPEFVDAGRLGDRVRPNVGMGGGVGIDIAGNGSGGSRTSAGGMGSNGGMIGRGGPGGQAGGGAMGGPPPRSAPLETLPELVVRWESALPVQQALLKIPDAVAPAMDEAHFAITVMNVPRSVALEAEKGRPKPSGVLRVAGKKPIKASEARMIIRDDGSIALFLFPRRFEISARDTQVEFDGQVGSLHVKQSFDIGAMKYHGKLEL